MENNELNERILKSVRNRIVVSNLESEEKMKLNKKTRILSLAVVLVMVLSGGFITVNATTDGKLVENIKNTIKVIFVNENGTEKEAEGKAYTDSNGDTWINYETNINGTTTQTDINKTELDKENMKIEEKVNENGAEDSLEVIVK